jgi:hypothetical protein
MGSLNEKTFYSQLEATFLDHDVLYTRVPTERQERWQMLGDQENSAT